MNKLYAITRRDLSDGAQAAQLFHAGMAFSLVHPKLCAEWNADSNNVVLLSIANEVELEQLYQQAETAGFYCVRFNEPDFDDQLTAIALMGEGAEKLMSCLPLALRARKEAA